MNTKIRIVRELMTAVERKDDDGVLDLLTDDVEYHYHVGSRPLLGKDWVRKFLKRYHEQHSETLWVVSTFAETDNKLLVEGLEEYVNEAGEQVSHPYMGIFEFRDDKIFAWREYFQL